MNTQVTVTIQDEHLETLTTMAELAHVTVNELLSHMIAEAAPSMGSAVGSLVKLSDMYKKASNA